MGGVVGRVLKPVLGDMSGDPQAQAAREASGVAAKGQEEALAYMKEKEALPLEMRDKFLPMLSGIYQGGEEQQQLIDSAMNSPYYKAQMANKGRGEEAILRNASATGSLRSGNVQGNMYEYNTRYDADTLNNAYQQQLAGISGLANQSLNTNAIAGATAAPYQSRAQGITGAAQAKSDAQQGWMNLVGGAGGQLGGAAIAKYSDPRAKEEIELIGKKGEHNWYRWTWNKVGEALGLSGKSEGVMANEVYDINPDAIETNNGLLMVRYDMLNLGES